MAAEAHHKRHLSGSSTLSTTSSIATSDVDSSIASNITSTQSDSTNGRYSPNNNEIRTHIEEKDSDSISGVKDEVLDDKECKSPGNCHENEKSVPQITTKLSALKITAAQSLQAKKNSESVPSESHSQGEFALPTHRLEPETTGDGGSSSSATESTLPETPLSDMSAPFDSHSGDGLDSGIDETRGSKLEKGILDAEQELSDQEELIDNKSTNVADMNANNPIIGSTSQEEINKFLNAKQEKRSHGLTEDFDGDTEGIHATNDESESFQKVHQHEHSSQNVTLSQDLTLTQDVALSEEVTISQELTLWRKCRVLTMKRK